MGHRSIAPASSAESVHSGGTDSLGPPPKTSVYALIATISLAAVAVLGYLLRGDRQLTQSPEDWAFLATVNASLNTASAISLIRGYVAIRQGNPKLHRACMTTAFIVSALFLVSYLAYHALHGDTPYPGTGTAKVAYLILLASHVLTSILCFPMVLMTFYLGYKGSWARHRRLARWTFPLWTYVSVTGVAVYIALRLA